MGAVGAAVSVVVLVDYMINKALEVVPYMPLTVITNIIIKILSIESDYARHNGV